MNLYLVVSEEIEYRPMDGPIEWGWISELVVARNNSQARYLAWKEYKHKEGESLTDMPKFRTECKAKGVNGPARVIVDDGSYPDEYWAFRDELGDNNEPVPSEV